MKWAKRLGVVKNKSCFWSDQHQYILWYCAKKICSRFSFVDFDDLVNEGYVNYLRYRKNLMPVDVKSCMSAMYAYIYSFYLKKGVEFVSPEELKDVCVKYSIEVFDNFQDLYEHYVSKLSANGNRRKVFELRFVQNKSTNQIGREIGVSGQAVSNMLRNTIRDLRLVG